MEKRGAGRPVAPLRLRKVQMGHKRCAEVAPYGIIRYQTKPADAVHDQTSCATRVCRACVELPICVAVRNPALRRVKEMGAHCAPLR